MLRPGVRTAQGVVFGLAARIFARRSLSHFSICFAMSSAADFHPPGWSFARFLFVISRDSSAWMRDALTRNRASRVGAVAAGLVVCPGRGPRPNDDLRHGRRPLLHFHDDIRLVFVVNNGDELFLARQGGGRDPCPTADARKSRWRPGRVVSRCRRG